MGTDTWYHGHLHELSQAECLELIATKSVGRIAYDGPDGPEVVPLNFVVEDGSVLFRTTPYSSLGRNLRLRVAAFEVDEVDDFTQSGWSVVLRGMVEPVDPDDLPPEDQRPDPWPEGARVLHLRLQPRTTTGRRLMPA